MTITTREVMVVANKCHETSDCNSCCLRHSPDTMASICRPLLNTFGHPPSSLVRSKLSKGDKEIMLDEVVDPLMRALQKVKEAEDGGRTES